MMRGTFDISDVVIHDALPVDKLLGLICFASLRLGAFRLDSLQVRRNREGGHYVKWPTHKVAAGYEHPFIEIADATIRTAIHRAVEDAVLRKARGEGRIP